LDSRRVRLRQQTDSGHSERGHDQRPRCAFLDDEPVGWCAVEPRSHHEGLVCNLPGHHQERDHGGIPRAASGFTTQAFRWRRRRRAEQKSAAPPALRPTAP